MVKLIEIVFVACLSVIILPTTMPTSTPPPPCEEGWTHFNDSCYIVVESHKTWDKASDYCGMEDSYLIEINSVEERDFVKDTLLSKIPEEEKIWIGATLYRVCEGEFHYRRSGEPVQDYWAPGQPSLGPDELFVGMSLSNDDVKFYDELGCIFYFFACEKAKM